MKQKLKIGIAYDVKEDYHISANTWKHRDFSTLAEIKYVKEVLEERGHTVFFLGNYEKIYNMLQNKNFPQIDIVLNTAEGISSRNRESWLPSLFEMNHIPYSGSDAYALGIALSKIQTKITAEYLHIPTPPHCCIFSLNDVEKALNDLSAPWILKPNYEGSSSGVLLAETAATLRKNAEFLLNEYQQPLVCETYIKGKEYNVSLLYDGDNTQVIGTVEIVRKNGKSLEIFDVRDKFTGTCTKIPAQLSQDICKKMEDDTIKIHKFLNFYDYNRADFRVDENGKHYLLELNPLPSIDDESGYAKCCEYNGIKLGKALEEVLYNAILRNHQKN